CFGEFVVETRQPSVFVNDALALVCEVVESRTYEADGGARINEGAIREDEFRIAAEALQRGNNGLSPRVGLEDGAKVSALRPGEPGLLNEGIRNGGHQGDFLILPQAFIVHKEEGFGFDNRSTKGQTVLSHAKGRQGGLAKYHVLEIPRIEFRVAEVTVERPVV